MNTKAITICGKLGAALYVRSYNEVGDGFVFMAGKDGRDFLVAVGVDGFEGEKCGCEKCGCCFTVAEKTYANARRLRELFPFTAPSPVLRQKKSFGVGDRLGIAIPGHIRVFEKYPDVYPVFAQQSIRELNLTNRNYSDVLDAVTYGVFRDGFRRPWGADGDHLKKEEDVRMALDLGFSMITLDCSEHIHGEEGVNENAPGAADYVGKTFELENGLSVSYTAASFARISYVYGEMIGFACSIWDKFFASSQKADFELSIDETATPTDPAAHYYVANELTKHGVKLVTVAPRFCGEFQKGIDYIGDVGRFDAELKYHAAIARRFGYKLSIHSGSDKFSVFPSIGRETNGNFHVKTAGTNWLEAMRVVAQADPAFYRELHKFALAHFEEATKYYHVTTNLNNIPNVDTVADADLPALFGNNDSRQLIHITYGLILNVPAYREKLYALWAANEIKYTAALLNHIGRHLELLGC